MNAERCDVLVIGAGPAGMSAAVDLAEAGHHVIVVDDQPSPGGQVWRNVEAAGGARREAALGADYASGREVVDRFRASRADYRPSTEVWQIEAGWQVSCRSETGTSLISADHLLISCGAQERSVPFAGWTLPGVLTVGAAQTLLKTTGDIPDGPVWIAGSGPLCLLYMRQLVVAGGKIAGFLHTGSVRNAVAALPKLPAAIPGWRELMHGLGWMASVSRAGVPVIRIDSLEALGSDRLEAIRYVTRFGRRITAKASILLVHEGVIPSVHVPVAAGCHLEWSDVHAAFVPQSDTWGRTGIRGLWLAGDVAGIGGARAAGISGSAAALAIDAELRAAPLNEEGPTARRLQAARGRERAIRPFLDAFYRPGTQLHTLSNDVVICRCEEISAGEIRAALTRGALGHNEVKARTRAGMGMCQGRQCGLTIAALVSSATSQPVAAIGAPNVRPPLRPVTLGEIAREVMR